MSWNNVLPYWVYALDDLPYMWGKEVRQALHEYVMFCAGDHKNKILLDLQRAKYGKRE